MPCVIAESRYQVSYRGVYHAIFILSFTSKSFRHCLRPELREPTTLITRTRELLVPVELRIRFPHRLEPPVPREVEMVVGVFKRSGKGTFPQRPTQWLVAGSTLPPRSVPGILDRIQQQVKFLRRLSHMKLQQIEIQ